MLCIRWVCARARVTQINELNQSGGSQYYASEIVLSSSEEAMCDFTGVNLKIRISYGENLKNLNQVRPILRTQNFTEVQKSTLNPYGIVQHINSPWETKGEIWTELWVFWLKLEFHRVKFIAQLGSYFLTFPLGQLYLGEFESLKTSMGNWPIFPSFHEPSYP